MVGTEVQNRIQEWITDPDNINDYNLTLPGYFAAVNYASHSCGPLSRTELFFQGCHHHCKGCFSTETWDPAGGDRFTVRQVLEFIVPVNEHQPSRISICGGEPLDQPEFLFRLLYALRSIVSDLSLPVPTVLLYTGYPDTYLFDGEYGDMQPIADLIDMAVTGPFEIHDKCLDVNIETDFVGSANQNFFVVMGGQPMLRMDGCQANRVVSDPRAAGAIDDMARLIRSEYKA